MQRIKMKLNSYDHKLLDAWVRKIVEATKRSEASVRVVPLPTETVRFAVRRSTFVNSKSGYKYRQATHKRLIVISYSSSSAVLAELTSMDLPAGIDVKVKVGSE